MSNLINICGAPVGSSTWNAGNALFQNGLATNNGAEEFLGSIVMNGWNGDAAAVWGAIASFGAMTFDLPQALVGAAGTVVSAITGAISAAMDPSQGGACKTTTGTPATSTAQLNQVNNTAFYNLTGMSPMQWTASNGAYSDSQTSNTGSVTAVVGGYSSSGRQ